MFRAFAAALALWTACAARAGDLNLQASPLIVYDRLGDAISVANRFTDDQPTVQITSFSRLQDLNWRQSHFDGYQELATAATTDGAGNVYVTGFRVNQGAKLFWLIKYTQTGDLAWERADIYSDCVAVSVTADEAGSVWIGGSCAVNQTFPVRFMRFGPQGDQVWSANYNGGVRNYVKALSVDYSGRLSASVLATHGNYVDGPSSLKTVVFDQSGGQLAVY